MPRAMSPAMLAAIQDGAVRPALLVEMTFATEAAYMWTGLGDLAWNGQTWKGLGRILGLTVIEDGATVEARGTAITLTGIDAALLADCMADVQLGLPAIIYLALFDATPALIVDPIPCWVGRVDQPVVASDGKTATISIQCESRLLDLNNPVDRRYTQQDQQMDWPGDLGMNFVMGIQEMTLYWGVALSSTNV